jgi:small basic protein
MRNWKTTATGILGALTACLTALAALPAQLGDISTLIPEQYKAKIVVVGMISTVILRVIKSLSTADAPPNPPTT